MCTPTCLLTPPLALLRAGCSQHMVLFGLASLPRASGNCWLWALGKYLTLCPGLCWALSPLKGSLLSAGHKPQTSQKSRLEPM